MGPDLDTLARVRRRAAGEGAEEAVLIAPSGTVLESATSFGSPALGDEVGVGVGDGVAGDAQVGRERAGGGQPGAGGQPAGAHGLAQGVGQAPAQARSGRLHQQVDAQSGP
ncbi:hypothetical protein HDC93_004339 [Streptomyces sp. AK010]|nr:hypothetical protein [Streptomyces sp. AK010]